MHALYFVRYIYFFFVKKKNKNKKKKQKKIPFRCFSFRRFAVPCSVVPLITNNQKSTVVAGFSKETAINIKMQISSESDVLLNLSL